MDSKVKLATALELGRSSMFYWFASQHDSKNSYFKAFYSNTSNTFPLSCTSYIDLCMYLASYPGYCESNCSTASYLAGLDGAYQSGLAGMPGGACY
jgi:hypothetical protein